MTKHIDNIMFKNMLRVLNSSTGRHMLQMIGVDGAMQYNELMKFVHTTTKAKASGLTAFHIRKLLKANMIKRDDPTRRYFLTRIGIEALSLITSFEEICTKFDLDDCDADGRIATRIIDRKNEDKLPEEDKIKCIICPHTAKSVKSIRIHHRMMHG